MNRFLVASLSFLVVAPAISAQQARPDPEALFKRLDKNSDGSITSEELPPERRANIKRFDTDGDGKISLQEHIVGLGGRPGATPVRPSNRPTTAAVPDTLEAKLDLPYADNDNPRQQLDLYLPKRRTSDKPLPVIVFIHGGGWKAGDRKSGMRNVAPYVASGDYAGVSVGYRLTNEAQWPAQIHDCKAAIRWIRGHAKEFNLDADHIGVWGSSAGGHLVSIVGTSGDVPALEGRLGSYTTLSSRVQAVVNYYGPENFITMVTQPSTVDRTVPGYPEAVLIGGRVQDMTDAAKNASPVTYISKDDPPFLTAHGTKDPLVPFAQAKELEEKLQAVGVPSTLITMKDGGHGFGSTALDDVVRRFFDKTLRGIDGKVEDTTIVVDKPAADWVPALKP
jgi:acetyl esterase/lipase